MIAEFTGQLVRASLRKDGMAYLVINTKPKKSDPLPGDLKDSVNLADLERGAVTRALSHYPTLEKAADALGINASTLWRKRRIYGL